MLKRSRIGGKNTPKNYIYIKNLSELDYYNGVVSHPEPDILECKVKWALRSTAVNKDSGLIQDQERRTTGLSAVTLFV